MTSDTLQIDDVVISIDEAAETLRAIRSGQVDAVVINGANGHDVFTFRDPDHAYRALVEAMGEGAALVTRDGIIGYHNPRFAELTIGSRAASLRGKAFHELVPTDAVVAIDAMLERAQRGPARIEVGLTPRDGNALTVQLTASATSVADVDVLCVIATDLSEQRAQAELHREALIGMEARERLISIAGHELRAPMQVLVSELGVLLAQHPAITVEQLAAIQRLGFRLANLVTSLLDVGLLGSDQLVLSLEDLDLADLVRAIADRSEDVMRSGSPVTVEARSARGRWDRGRLEQVVTNLLSNAGKYGLGKPIRIAVDGDDEEVARLVVEDRGIGIAPDAIGRLFRPFERIGSVKTATGLGLGLYISAQIVRAHGGVMRVESDPGVGSRFIVELPYRRTQRVEP
ncbi:MAG: PAS domain S-box protein [Deltaproteobacteria bacterium]|nr:MAG: PAS domain S-box protein [Deltaproteobacteria bacterium]TMQ20025.1 MAG: PAS domain S-box protein [Deltaproteobacteria bacterium]